MVFWRLEERMKTNNMNMLLSLYTGINCHMSLTWESNGFWKNPQDDKKLIHQFGSRKKNPILITKSSSPILTFFLYPDPMQRNFQHLPLRVSTHFS
jgi:hypothetical protein